MSTMQRVREAISQSHDAIEQTDFAKSLLDGRITRPAYGVYLNQLWHIHHALEKSMAECPLVASFLSPAMMRTATLVKDAAVMGQAIDASSRLPRTRDIESTIFKWFVESPFALLGCLYILEGSRMGSLMIAKPLAKSLHLSETTIDQTIAGIEYHMEGAADTPRRVRQLKADIDALNLSSADELQLSDGACVFMSLLKQLYDVLPINDSPKSSFQGSLQGGCPFAHRAALVQAQLRSA